MSEIPDPEPTAILDRMTDAFFALDIDRQFTYLNDHGRKIICDAIGEDLTIDELTGRHIWEEIPEAVDTTFYDQYEHALDTQEPVDFEEYYPPLDTWFDVRAYPSESGLSVYFRDVTERKQRERRLERQAQQFEGFGQIMVHDLKNPLSIATRRVELAQQTQDITHLDTAAESLARVDDLLDEAGISQQSRKLGTYPRRADSRYGSSACSGAVSASAPAKSHTSNLPG